MSDNKFSNQTYLRTSQYKTDNNLNARIALHKHYSINPMEWQSWVFEKAKINQNSVILEVGCGPGNFWEENLASFPEGVNAVLSDFSLGMVKKATRLKKSENNFGFANLDIMHLPFKNRVFDRVIANHMLYHVPDIPLGIQEVSRVLKTDGLLIAATNGDNHMKEIFDLGKNFYPDKTDLKQAMRGFTLENGQKILSEFFYNVDLVLYEDEIKVPVVEPVKNYILSMISIEIQKEDVEKLEKLIQDKIDQHGYFHIQKASGIFIASHLKHP